MFAKALMSAFHVDTKGLTGMLNISRAQKNKGTLVYILEYWACERRKALRSSGFPQFNDSVSHLKSRD